MHLSAGAHGRSRTVVHGAPRCQAAGMHQGAGAHRWWCTVVHGAIRCQAAGMHLGARCTQASVHLLRDSLITHNTTSVPKRPDAPRCTVQYGARRPGCTSVQVHGDPNAPHQGAGAARAPCVTLRPARATISISCRAASAAPHWMRRAARLCVASLTLYFVRQRPDTKGAPPLYLTPLPNGPFPWRPPD